jgi:hypothetical protein
LIDYTKPFLEIDVTGEKLALETQKNEIITLIENLINIKGKKLEIDINCKCGDQLCIYYKNNKDYWSGNAHNMIIKKYFYFDTHRYQIKDKDLLQYFYFLKDLTLIDQYLLLLNMIENNTCDYIECDIECYLTEITFILPNEVSKKEDSYVPVPDLFYYDEHNNLQLAN